jgi:hypothetical protein
MRYREPSIVQNYQNKDKDEAVCLDISSQLERKSLSINGKKIKEPEKDRQGNNP